MEGKELETMSIDNSFEEFFCKGGDQPAEYGRRALHREETFSSEVPKHERACQELQLAQ